MKYHKKGTGGSTLVVHPPHCKSSENIIASKKCFHHHIKGHSCVGFAIRHMRVSAFVMRKQNTIKRIKNPNIHVVWITAWRGELKVANPDNLVDYGMC